MSVLLKSVPQSFQPPHPPVKIKVDLKPKTKSVNVEVEPEVASAVHTHVHAFVPEPVQSSYNSDDEPNLHDMFERVIVQLKDKLSKKEHRVRDLEAKIMLEREQHQLLLAEKDQELVTCRQELKKQADTYRNQVDSLTKKFNHQLEMCNKLVDLALKTNNLMKN